MLIVFTTLLTAFLIYKSSEESMQASSKQQLLFSSQIIKTSFNSFIENVERDIQFLSNNPLLELYLNTETNPKDKEKYKQQLELEFLALIKSKSEYSQIRLISEKGNGKEIIRAERLNDSIRLIKESGLQIKGDRSYYLETKIKEKGSYYFSVIDLNKEYGKISIPITPTFRSAAPLYNNLDSFYGIVILNIDLSHLFKKLNAFAQADYEFYLFNDKNQFIQHPIDSLCFAFEYNKNINFNDYIQDQNIIFDKVQEGKDNMIQVVSELKFPKKTYRLFIGLTSEKNIFFKKFTAWKWNILLITLGSIILSLIVAMWSSYTQANQLRNITNSLLQFSDNPTKIPDIDIARKDEIGILAKSFNSMAQQINTQVSELSESRKIAVQANKDKEEFLENMSHEMRNPLQSILGVSQLISQNNPKPEQKVFIETLEFSAQNLLSLVNDVLDFKKLKLGLVSLQFKDVAILENIESIVKYHQFEAGLKKIKILFHHNLNSNELFFTDQLRLNQILNNLLSNAIKFTPEGGQINIIATKIENDTKSELCITIKDNGIGISQENIDKITNRYVSTPHEFHSIGHGIGLNIVTNILKLFNSKLEVISEKNKGSTFTFNLKGKFRSQDKKIELLDKINHYYSPFKSTVCIDDDPQILFWYEHYFSKYQIEVFSFNSIEEFLKSDINEIDLLISDLNFSISEDRVKFSNLSEHLSKHGLFIIVSGTKNDSLIQEIFGTAVDLTFQKPIDPDQFLKLIHQKFNSKYLGNISFNQLYKDYDFDHSKLKHVLNIFIEEWQEMLINLTNAIEAKNITQYNNVIHKLNTSLRRLDLIVFLNYLENLGPQLSELNEIQRLKQQQIIQFIMYTCIEKFKEQKQELQSKIV
ncbi:MAG TPA: ATP-binding protein [Saprospiraceae bacterium]|nr:ATP-binding protein [Saprospiraceae bacterium]